MVWRLESSQVCLVLLPMVLVLVDCHLLSIVVDFILLFSIYIAFYFELADDTYSVRIPCTDPYLYFLLVVLWSAASAPSTSTRPQLQPVSSTSDFRVSYYSQLGLDSLIHVLMSLKFGHGPSFYLFQLLKYSQIQKFEDRCSWCDDFQILGIIIDKLQKLNYWLY